MEFYNAYLCFWLKYEERKIFSMLLPVLLIVKIKTKILDIYSLCYIRMRVDDYGYVFFSV